MLSFHYVNKMNNRLVSMLDTAVHLGQPIIINSHYRYNGTFLIEETDLARMVPSPLRRYDFYEQTFNSAFGNNRLIKHHGLAITYSTEGDTQPLRRCILS